MGMQWKARAITAEQADELLGTQDVPKRLFSSGQMLRLDQAWHGLHWLLAGDLWKPSPGAGGAILNGTPVGEDLYGYGSALLVSATEVVEIATGLDEITTDDLRARYDLKAIRRAEPSPFYGRWKSAHFDEFLLPAYLDLSTFYAKAANRGSSVVLVIY